MKINGLPYFQRLMLKSILNARNIDGDFDLYFEDSISLRRLHSLWYGGGVVNIRYKGYIYHIEAVGDVYANLYAVHDGRCLCYVKDKSNNGNFGSEMLSYIKSDAALEDALSIAPRRYLLEMDHNNWWECFVTDPQGVFHDLMLNLDADKLFDAIADVLRDLDEIINYVEG